MKSLKGKTFPYLNKGFVEVIDYMGDDTSLAMAARASFNKKEYKSKEANIGLINYLIEHKHSSPIEMGEIIFRVKVPIFVARQHMRHRTASINEQSLRYVEHDGDYYIPTKERIRYQHEHKKQGSGDTMPEHIAETVLEIFENTAKTCWKNYDLLIKAGVALELSRAILPVSSYTTLVWKMDLHNMLHYLNLRMDAEHAQSEIVDLANIFASVIQDLFPETYKAWEEFVKDSVTFSATEVKVLKKLLNGVLKMEDLENDDFVMGSKRRMETFLKKVS